MKFTYGSGTRVLDGYTLKRGIGRGGFGEVYYALSDGGKEVALKLIRGANLDVELRGMAQCLNLKHPNLLQLYDIRGDAAGEHWVVMEYISGEALSNVINRHPEGLPLDLTQQWFREIGRGVGCLHTHGIVHRDLKPANVFLEAGTVKIGDYGLSKFMSSTQHTAQTQSIGTVHYMAPEISTGNYNKQIDVYASGIILYEMLTGHVPFDGESAGEILMKHMTSPPDLAKIPPPCGQRGRAAASRDGTAASRGHPGGGAGLSGRAASAATTSVHGSVAAEAGDNASRAGRGIVRLDGLHHGVCPVGVAGLDGCIQLG
jgi:serine/threonine protein kinase